MDPRMRAQRPHAGLQRCVEEIDRHCPNLGRIPCESANVRKATGSGPNRRYTDLQRHPEKQCLRGIGLTIARPNAAAILPTRSGPWTGAFSFGSTPTQA